MLNFKIRDDIIRNGYRDGINVPRQISIPSLMPWPVISGKINTIKAKEKIINAEKTYLKFLRLNMFLISILFVDCIKITCVN